MKILFVVSIFFMSVLALKAQTDSVSAQKVLFEVTRKIAATDKNMALALGHMYYDGIGTSVNLYLAFEWYKKATKLDNKAKFRLMEFYYFGTMNVVDNKKVLSLLDELIAADYEPAIDFARIMTIQAETLATKDIDKITGQEQTKQTDANLFFENGKTIKYVPAEFPGGEPGLRKYLGQFVYYPENILVAFMKEGRVVVRATIDVSGKTKNVKLIKSLSPDLDFMLIRAVRDMPTWSPGYTEKEYQGEIKKRYLPFVRMFTATFKLLPAEEDVIEGQKNGENARK